MGHRWELEDRYTVTCRACGGEFVDPAKKPAQKYVIGVCPGCRVDSATLSRRRRTDTVGS